MRYESVPRKMKKQQGAVAQHMDLTLVCVKCWSMCSVSGIFPPIFVGRGKTPTFTPTWRMNEWVSGIGCPVLVGFRANGKTAARPDERDDVPRLRPLQPVRLNSGGGERPRSSQWRSLGFA